MINVFKKIWKFSEKEQINMKKSILFAFLNALFNSFQFMAVYIMLNNIFSDNLSKNHIYICSAILLVSLLGKIYTLNKSAVLQTHAGYFMAAHKRIEIGEKLKKVPMGFFSEFSLGKLTDIATTNLSKIEMWVPMLLVLVLGGFLTSMVFIICLFIFNQKVGYVAVIGMILFLIVTSIMEKKSRENSYKVAKAREKLTKEVLSTLQGMQVIKSYNLGGKNNKKLDDAFNENYKIMLGLEKSMIPFVLIQRIVISITIGFMLYMSISQGLLNSITLSDTIMTLIAGFIIFEGLIGAGSNMAILRITEDAINHTLYVDEIPNMKEKIIDEKIDSYDIKFDKVFFSYDQRQILKDITCEFKENTMTAIVGPSGSGKTTMSRLIARFWDVDSGSIKIGKRDIRDYTLKNLMSNISFVFQNVYLFNDTIYNNIRFGNPSATKEDIIASAKKAECHEFIMGLPEGYQTIIGEGGASLSGGEKQRIAIARAIIKDAPIIIFDEATANVDPENEDKLQKAIESLIKNKTIIMIAHRLKTIKNANNILVLNDGYIEESGTHEELLKNNGLYRKLINAKDKSFNWKIKN